MNLDMAVNYLPRDTMPAEFLAQALESALKATEVSSMLLTYIGTTQRKRETLDLSETCLKSLSMLRDTTPKSLRFETRLPSPGPAANANSSQIQQVLINLITNAWESYEGREGRICLTVKTLLAADITPKYRFPIDYQIKGDAYACLEVADTGCGIAQKDIPSLFDPFHFRNFTGRGLGLAVVLGILRAHKGFVTVESELGRGSVFRVFLPLLSEVADRKSTSSPVQATNPAIGGTVLVVDDDSRLLKAISTALKCMGFKVLTAQDGVEAVEVFRQHQSEIRLVLCDMCMPRMDGWDTLAALRRLVPGIPVILSSGYGKDHTMADHHPEQPQLFLSKPYQIEEFHKAIIQVLGCPTLA
jgi:CheY-like chemotaxis protein